MTLSNKVAVVTGGASGIGRGVAERFARAGARVVIADIDQAGAEAAAAAIRDFGGEASAHQTDVADEGSVEALCQAVVGRWGALHIIVNNAGIDQPQSLTDMSSELYDRVMAVDLRSIFLTSKVGAPLIAESGGGSIINISSIMAWYTHPGYVAYTAAKAGVIGMTRTLAVELGPLVRVNAICPGFIDTPIWERALAAMPPEQAETYAQRIGAMHPVKRRGTPADIASAALFLASAEASFITGTHLIVDGGVSLKLLSE
ncbi:MAG: SDR family oxidoreductase [Trueperaceae bacterium]|nr:MAG: SDR family oxidoreductase [Trueperaceae bacterium]